MVYCGPNAIEGHFQNIWPTEVKVRALKPQWRRNTYMYTTWPTFKFIPDRNGREFHL